MAALRRLPLVRLAPLALLLLTACGEERLPPEHWLERLGDPTETRRDEAVRELGKWGREDPARVLPLLTARMEAERGHRLGMLLRIEPATGPLADDDKRAHAVSRIVHALHLRLRLMGRATPQTRVDGSVIELAVVPPRGVTDLDAEERRLVAALQKPGAVELRVELPPPFVTTPERPVSPWVGDLASYEAWLAEDTRRLDAARAGGPAYSPSAEGRELVLRRADPDLPADAAQAVRYVPLLAAGDLGERFTEEDLVISPQDDNQSGVPSLYITSLETRHEAFQVFLKRHAGLRLWLLLDDEAVVSGLLPGNPGVVVSMPVKAPTLGEARTRAARLRELAATGRYPVPITLRALPRPPAIAADDPVARAVVEVGLPAEAALEELVKRDASWESLVLQLKADIVKGQTRR